MRRGLPAYGRASRALLAFTDMRALPYVSVIEQCSIEDFCPSTTRP
jgi:hypothetical protein